MLTTTARSAAADSRFEACLAETLRWESGEVQQPFQPIRRGRYSWANDPHDPGGPTMCGVIQRVYDGWRRGQGLQVQTVRDITDDEIRAIYRTLYWDKLSGDELPPGVDLAVFDFGVNSGVTRSIKYVQRVVGVAVDGHMGAVTLDAIRRADPERLVTDLMAARAAFVRQIRTYWRFGKGWERRLAGVGPAALAMVRPDMTHEIAHTVAMHDIGSVEVNGRAVSEPPSSMHQSTEGNAAVAVGGGGGVNTAVEVTSAVARASDKAALRGDELSMLDVLLALGQSPTFWIGVATIAGAAFIWLRRRNRMQWEGA